VARHGGVGRAGGIAGRAGGGGGWRKRLAVTPKKRQRLSTSAAIATLSPPHHSITACTHSHHAHLLHLAASAAKAGSLLRTAADLHHFSLSAGSSVHPLCSISAGHVSAPARLSGERENASYRLLHNRRWRRQPMAAGQHRLKAAAGSLAA